MSKDVMEMWKCSVAIWRWFSGIALNMMLDLDYYALCLETKQRGIICRVLSSATSISMVEL